MSRYDTEKIPRYTLRQLAYFVAAADTGMTTKAAAQFYVSQSALTSALNELEASLGVQLLIRTKGRGVSLTDAGRDILAQARSLLAAAEEISITASDLGTGISGTLNIGCFEMIAPALVPRMIAGFAHVHPNVVIDFVEGTQQVVTEALDTGRIEVAFQFQSSLGAGMASAVLSTPTAHVLLPSGHPLASASSLRLALLRDEPFVLMTTDAGRAFMTGAFREAGVEPNVRFRSGNFDHIRALIGRGLGYTVVMQSEGGWPRALHSGIVSIPLNDPIPDDPIVIAAREDAKLTRRARAFWDYAVETSTSSS